MATQPKPSELNNKAQKIKAEIDSLIHQMDQEPHFTPKLATLEQFAEELIDLINHCPLKIANRDQALKSSVEKHIKAAIIDLTEIPTMAPTMQRIAYYAGLKDASKNIALFLR